MLLNKYYVLLLSMLKSVVLLNIFEETLMHFLRDSFKDSKEKKLIDKAIFLERWKRFYCHFWSV